MSAEGVKVLASVDRTALNGVAADRFLVSHGTKLSGIGMN